MNGIEIACPRCAWQPDGGAYWMCEICQHVWNTFETGGKCPACSFEHDHTSCIPWRGGCEAYEPHADWYHGFDAWFRELTEPQREPQAGNVTTEFDR